METKESLLFEFAKSKPTDSSSAEFRQYSQERVKLEALLDLRDTVVQLVAATTEKK